REVAQALAALTGGRSREVAADLAVLFETAGDFAKAAEHFHHAARNAARLFAYPEAVLLCERGLKALSQVPPAGDRDQRELALLLILSIALMTTRGYAAPEVENAHRRSLELCKKLKDTRRLMPVLWGLHTCEVNNANLAGSLMLAEEMRSIAEADGTPS